MRAIFLPSNKGGIGKTTFARFLAELLRERKANAILVDADKGVGQLLKHLGERDGDGKLKAEQTLERGVLTMDWHADVRGRDEIASTLAHGRDVLFDLPGGSLGTFKALDDETRFFADVLPSLGFSATVVAMITPYRETWADAATIRKWLPSVDLLLVVNEGFSFGSSRSFRKWNGSDTRTALLKSGAREIVFPGLDPLVAADIADYRLRFIDAPTSDRVEVMDRGRAMTWLNAATAAVERASDILGTASVVPA